MVYRRWRNIAIIVIVFAILLAACAREVTPEPTEEPPATEVEDVDAENADVEETEVADVEETEEADMDAEETEEADMDAEATEEADMDAEATEEADMDAEATEEADMEDVDAEATEEADMDAEATEEADMEDMDAAMAELVSSDAAELGLPYSFDYPSDFEASTGASDTVSLTRGEQKVVVIGPDSYSNVLGTQEFESDAEQLGFFLDRAGYDVGEETPMMMGIVSMDVALPRAGQVGAANLVDLDNGRRAVVIELGPDADNVPGAVGGVVMGSIVYPPNLADVAANTEGFSTLLAAVDAAGIDLTSGEYTVFAPTDEAFAAALDTLGISAEDLLADTETLTSILNYHIVEGTVLAEDVMALDGEEVTTVNGATVTVGVTDDGVTLTDVNGNVVNVVTTDVVASNGVIHVIDGVLMPPAPEEDVEEPETDAEETDEAAAPTVTIVGLAVNNEDLSTLASAVVRAGLTGTLNSEGPYTVFAPTNDAFAAVDVDMSDREALASVLTYHVVDGAVMSGDLTDGMEVTTLNGATLTIGVTDEGVTVTDGAGNTYNVVTADVAASNGVVHVIDGVLMTGE